MKVRLSWISSGRRSRRIMAENDLSKDGPTTSTHGITSRNQSFEEELNISSSESEKPVDQNTNEDNDIGGEKQEATRISNLECTEEVSLMEDLDPSADVSPPDLTLLAHFADDGLSSAEESFYDCRPEALSIYGGPTFDGSCTPRAPLQMPTAPHVAYNENNQDNSTHSLQDLSDTPESTLSRFPILARQLMAPLGHSSRADMPTPAKPWLPNAAALGPTVTSTGRGRGSPKFGESGPASTLQAPGNGVTVTVQPPLPSFPDVLCPPPYSNGSDVTAGTEESDVGVKLPPYFPVGHEMSRVLHGGPCSGAATPPSVDPCVSFLTESPRGQHRDWHPIARPFGWPATTASAEASVLSGSSGDPVASQTDFVCSLDLAARAPYTVPQYSFPAAASVNTGTGRYSVGSCPALMEQLISPSLNRAVQAHGPPLTTDGAPWETWPNSPPCSLDLNSCPTPLDGGTVWTSKDGYRQLCVQPSVVSFSKPNTLTTLSSANGGPVSLLTYSSLMQPRGPGEPLYGPQAVGHLHEDRVGERDVHETIFRQNAMTSMVNGAEMANMQWSNHRVVCCPSVVPAGHTPECISAHSFKTSDCSNWYPQNTSSSALGHSMLLSNGSETAPGGAMCYQAQQDAHVMKKRRYVTVRQMLERAKQYNLVHKSSACWPSDGGAPAVTSVALPVDHGILPLPPNYRTTTFASGAHEMLGLAVRPGPIAVTNTATVTASVPATLPRLRSPPSYTASAHLGTYTTACRPRGPGPIPVYLVQNPRMSMLTTAAAVPRHRTLLPSPDGVSAEAAAAMMQAKLVGANLRMVHWLKNAGWATSAPDKIRTPTTNAAAVDNTPTSDANYVVVPAMKDSFVGTSSAFKCLTPQVFLPNTTANEALVQGSIDARPAQHYELDCLQIGTFTVKQDLMIRKHVNKLKIFFSKRKFVYEFFVIDVPLPGHDPQLPHYACVDVPFPIVTGVHCDGNKILVSVRAPPQLYLNFRPNRVSLSEHCTACSRTRPTDITSGQLEKLHIHKILLKRKQAENLRSHLERFDPKYKAWFCTPIYETITDDAEQPSNSYTSFKRDGICSDSQVTDFMEPSAKKLCIHDVTSSNHNQGSPDLSNERVFCHCQVSCRSNRCSCMKSKSRCGMGATGCLCKDCNNPLNLLHKMGMHLDDIITDPCLIQGIVSFKGDVTSLLERQVIFPCCGGSAPLKECIPGKISCPNRSCTSQQIFKLSWCQLSLMDEEQNPRNHCLVCRTCKDPLELHCQACRRCNPVEGNSTKCSFCGAPRDTGFTEQHGVAEVLKRYREQQQQRSCNSNPVNSVGKEQAILGSGLDEKEKVPEEKEVEKSQEEEIQGKQKSNGEECLEVGVVEETVLPESDVELSYSPEVNLDVGI